MRETMDTHSVLMLLKDAAMKAGDELMRRFGSAGPLQGGGARSDMKTDADAACNDVIIKTLLEGWFSHSQNPAAVIAEELGEARIARKNADGYALEDFSGEIAEWDGPCFAVDSLCGSIAYARGVRDFCVSIAYLDGCALQAAVVYDPAHVELFHAAAGLGAYLNGKTIRVSGADDLTKAYVSIGHRALRTADGQALRALTSQAMRLRTGATCGLELCYAACGRIDAAIKKTQAFYDYAAGLLIAHEAGASVTDFKGRDNAEITALGERKSLVAACPALAGELLKTTRQL